MASNKNTSLTVKYSDLEADRLSFTDLEANERSKGQLIAYPRYNHPTLGEGQALFLQAPWITIFQYGVPSLGEYYQKDGDRAFIKVPLDYNDQDVMKMVTELKKVDKVYGSDEFKKKSFDKKASKYEYQPIIREPEEDDEGNTRPPYMKLKLDTSWPEGDVLTEVYTSEMVMDEESGKEVRKRTKVELTTVTEFAANVTYMCRFRPVFRPVKMWAHQQKMKDPQYGIVFKAIKFV